MLSQQGPPDPGTQASKVREVFDEPLIEGSVWCALSQRWWNLWCEFTGWDSEEAPGVADAMAVDDHAVPFRRSISGPRSGSAPPAIDNTHLTLRPTEMRPSDGGPLRRDLVEQRDFLLVPLAVWALLLDWYGGGPVLRRSVICIGARELLVELYPLQLTLYRVDSGGHPVQSSAMEVPASRARKVRDLIEDVCMPQACSPREVSNLQLWHRPDSSLDQTQVVETGGWEVVGPADYSLEDAGITDGVSLLWEQRVDPSREAESGGASGWPFFNRVRQEYRTSHFKDPRNHNGPPLVTGDQIDASAEVSYANGKTWLKWYPSTVVDEDADRVLLQFHYREPAPKRIPEVTKERKTWLGSSAVELTEETTAALRKVFEYYAKQDPKDTTHMDRRAIAALISCATNTMCQQTDYRVSAVMSDYDKDSDGRLTVDDFVAYWNARASASASDHWLKDELQRLYKRAKIEFGTPTEEERLLAEGKEWVLRASDRLAPAKTHVADYPYVSAEKRDFRDFRHFDKVDLRVGKEWVQGRLVKVDWEDFSVLVERTAPAEHGAPREWLPVESERLAPFQSKSLEQEDPDPSPKAAVATPILGMCPKQGACGLNNLGNTCFLNAVLQGLSNAVPLRQYYRSGDFKAEVSTSPLSMKGRLAKGFAELLDTLWADSHTTVSPSKLKALIGEKRPEFQGYQQHDAHEVLTFLLDTLHEDCNRAPYPRPIVEDPTTEGKVDVEVAEEAWQGYLRRNDSRIIDVFQFQVRSEVTFPAIGEKSLTFDPMMYLTLPVPKPPHAIEVTVLPLTYPDVAPVKCTLQIAKDKTIRDLEMKVLDAFPVSNVDPASSRCFVIADIYDNRVYKFYNNDQQVSFIRSSDCVWAFEVALETGVADEDYVFFPVNLRRRTKSAYQTTAWCSSSYSSSGDASGYSFSRFAPPQVFATRPGSTTNADVHKHTELAADRFRRFLGRPSGENAGSDVSLTVTAAYSTDEGTALPTSGIFKLCTADALSLNFLDLDTAGLMPLPEAAAGPGEAKGAGASGSAAQVQLRQCIDAFQQCEELSQDDWVYCRKTQDFERSTKKLDIWSAPKILIVHLKRFGRERLLGPLEKIESLVEFPLLLDLGPWIRGPTQMDGAQYALFAVVNHSGTLGFGHYTAYARVGENSDRQWFDFNDSTVTKINESQVVSKAAYILFYERVTSIG